mmetsp:Transcript_104471/g.304963  ORF Transcript_104471/g.304963 Transcript_104471/m.304963 type:complete len:240 (-) Transcript_104471:2561-3280(-)
MTAILFLNASSVSILTISSSTSAIIMPPFVGFSRYASSMNSTPPRADLNISRVLPLAWLAKPVTKSLAEHSTTSLLASNPSIESMRPILRATVVLPVPGAPANMKFSCRFSSGSLPSDLENSIASFIFSSLSLMPLTPIMSSKSLFGSSDMATSCSTVKKSCATRAALARSSADIPCKRFSIFCTALDSKLLTAPALPKFGSLRSSARLFTAARAVFRSIFRSSRFAFCCRIQRRSSSL